MRSPRHTHKELFSSRLSPLLSRGGVAAPSRKCREASFDGADGVVLVKKILFVVERTTPSAPNKVPSGNFIDGAATPPSPRRGLRASPTIFQGYAKKPVPWLISQHRSAVPTTHIDGRI